MKWFIASMLCIVVHVCTASEHHDPSLGDLRRFATYQSLRRRAQRGGIFKPVAKGGAIPESVLLNLEADAEDIQDEFHRSIHNLDDFKPDRSVGSTATDATGGESFWTVSSDSSGDDGDDESDRFKVLRRPARSKKARRRRSKPAVVGVVKSPPVDELAALLARAKPSAASASGKEEEGGEDEKDSPPLMPVDDSQNRMMFACRRLGAALWNAEHDSEAQVKVPSWKDDYPGFVGHGLISTGDGNVRVVESRRVPTGVVDDFCLRADSVKKLFVDRPTSA